MQPGRLRPQPPRHRPGEVGMASWLVRGDVVRRLRKALGLTQQQLADAACVGRRTLTRMECEPGVRFQFEHVRRVAQALGVPMALTDRDGLRSAILRYSD